MNDYTFAKEIVEYLKYMGETEADIEGVVIGGMGWGSDYNSEGIPDFKAQPRNTVISWDEARPWLEYTYSSGYGAPECNAIYIWTSGHVYFVSQYDGATSLCEVPRNPIDCSPDMPGG